MSEQIRSSKLVLLIETNKRTIRREFDNYAELFDYGTVALSDLDGGSKMYTHTGDQWANRGEHCSDFGDTG